MEKKVVKKVTLKEKELVKVVGGTTAFLDVSHFLHKNFKFGWWKN